MNERLAISNDPIAVFPGRPALDLGYMRRNEVTETLQRLVEDMSAAAVETGDHAELGPERAFAASRAITADELRDSLAHGVDPYWRDEETNDIDNEVEVMEEEEWL